LSTSARFAGFEARIGLLAGLVNRKSVSANRFRQGIAVRAATRFFLGQAVGALEDTVLLVDIERLMP
jgi:hypothetical protein